MDEEASKYREFNQAHDLVQRAIGTASGHADRLKEATVGFLNAAGHGAAPLDNRPLLDILPYFHASVVDWQHAYADLLAVEVVASPEVRPQMEKLRTVLAEFQELAAGVRATLLEFLRDSDRFYSADIAERVKVTLQLLADEWQFVETRGRAVLLTFDERIVPSDVSNSSGYAHHDREVDWRDHIHSNPKVLSGKPVIRGTRISVELLLDLFSAGWTESDVMESYPHLTHEGIRAAFAYASDSVARETYMAVAG